MDDWIRIDPNEVSKRQLISCASNVKFVAELFPPGVPHSRIEFGTAGLRAAFGAGPLRMNDVTVMQTAQGLLRQLEIDFGKEKLKQLGICVGYDHRESKEWGLSSRRFAVCAAAVFLAEGYDKVYLFDGFCPTPFVPYAIQTFHCLAGFMMTASHNPKEDAGFKVYWENACQLVSPKDDYVTKQILRDLTLSPKAVKLVSATDAESNIFSKCISTNMVADVAKSYCATAQAKLCRFREANSQSGLHKICYTAMHGVGLPFEQQMFEAFGHGKFVVVPSQAQPDADFPTVPFPNPEEKGALDLAVRFAEQNKCDLVVANDPDADRLAIAEFDRTSKQWQIFTGDEIAMLLASWEMDMFEERRNANSKPPAMVISAVSSGFVKHFGNNRGCQVFEALTGFKWIGSKALELRSKGFDVLFSYEEAIGFCVGDVIVDKDGITAGAVFVEMYNYLVSRNLTCAGKLKELRELHGYYLTQNGYIKTTSPKQYFAQIRNNGRYGIVVGKTKRFRITRIRDLGKDSYLDTAEASGTPELPSSSNMITLFLEPLLRPDGYQIRVTLRASGTEPKLKYYVEANGKDAAIVKKICQECVESAILGDLLSADTAQSKF